MSARIFSLISSSLLLEGRDADFFDCIYDLDVRLFACPSILLWKEDILLF